MDAADSQRPITHVEDDEIVRRAIRDDPVHYGCHPDGRLEWLGQSAFNDPDKTPSVDRAALQPQEPQAACRQENDGVVSLLTADVRAIRGLFTKDDKGRPKHTHAADVEHRPEKQNYAHALVATAPQITGGESFKRLKEALCKVALERGWSFPPASRR